MVSDTVTSPKELVRNWLHASVGFFRRHVTGISRLLLFLEFIGFLLAGYGLVRESFADLTTSYGYGELAYGEGSYGGGLTVFDEIMVNVGVTLRLLPTDHTLTLADTKFNAALAIVGFLVGGVAILFHLLLSFVPSKGQ